MEGSPVTEALDRAAPAAPPAHRYRAFPLRAGVGVAVIAVLLWHYDARPVLHQLTREDRSYFTAAIALYLVGQLICAYRWKLLAAVLDLRGTLTEFVAYTFIGMFTNLFVPGLVGGDAARAVYLGRRHRRMGEALASVVADRGIGLVALFLLAGFAATLLNTSLPPAVIRPTAIVGALSVAGYLVSPLIARMVHLAPRPIRRPAELVAPYLSRQTATLPAMGLSLVLQALLAIGQWLIALGLGLSTPLRLFLLCVPIANVAASLPVTLNGLGVRETTYLALLGMAGVSKDKAIALGLLWFAATGIAGLVGVLPFVLTTATEAAAIEPECTAS